MSTRRPASQDASGLEPIRSAPRRRVVRGAPHPLARVAERLGRSPGRQPLSDVFEQYLEDQLARDRVAPPARSALLPSRDLFRAHARRSPARRPDA
ncbi:MAG: hypothetical protein D6731_24955 [Planctomycetota bacterium]|nr:MAG: hypothetical protein D6731_24955 [Planctomycetota bacterium]